MAFRWLGWQLCFFEWQRVVWQRAGGAGASGPWWPSVDREEGALAGGRGRLLLLAVVDRFVIPQRVQAGVHAPANVTHWLPRGSHVYVLNMPFEPRQGR